MDSVGTAVNRASDILESRDNGGSEVIFDTPIFRAEAATTTELTTTTTIRRRPDDPSVITSLRPPKQHAEPTPGQEKEVVGGPTAKPTGCPPHVPEEGAPHVDLNTAKTEKGFRGRALRSSSTSSSDVADRLAPCVVVDHCGLTPGLAGQLNPSKDIHSPEGTRSRVVESQEKKQVEELTMGLNPEATGSLDPKQAEMLVDEIKRSPLMDRESPSRVRARTADSARSLRERMEAVVRRMETPLSMTVKIRSRGRTAQTDAVETSEIGVQAAPTTVDGMAQSTVSLPNSLSCVWTSHVTSPTAVVDGKDVHRDEEDEFSEAETQEKSANDPRRTEGTDVHEDVPGILPIDSVETEIEVNHDTGNINTVSNDVIQVDTHINVSPSKTPSSLFDFEELEEAEPSFITELNPATGAMIHVDSDGDVLPECVWSSDDDDNEGPRTNYFQQLPESDDEGPEDPGTTYWRKKLPDSDDEPDEVERWRCKLPEDSEFRHRNQEEVVRDCSQVQVKETVEKIEEEVRQIEKAEKKKTIKSIHRKQKMRSKTAGSKQKKVGTNNHDPVFDKKECMQWSNWHALMSNKMGLIWTQMLMSHGKDPMKQCHSGSAGDDHRYTMLEAMQHRFNEKKMTETDLPQCDDEDVLQDNDNRARWSAIRAEREANARASAKRSGEKKANARRREISQAGQRLIDRMLAALPEEVRKSVRLKMTRGITVDSGAADNVIPRRVLRKWMKIRQSEASRNGVHYVAADGARIANEGEVDFTFQDKDGRTHTWVFQVANVNKVLASVSSLVDCGHRVVFDKDEETGTDLSFITHKKTGDSIRMKRERNVWIIDAFVNDDADFARQE